MRYELAKIGRDKRLVMILAVIVLLNGVLFWKRCTGEQDGVTYEEMRTVYLQGGDLIQRQEELEQQALHLMTAEKPDWEQLDAISEESSHNEAVLKRMDPVVHYHENRQALIDESIAKVRLGMFGDVYGFSAQSLLRGAQAYGTLETITPSPVFLGGAEVLLDFPMSDTFLLIFLLIPGLTLFTFESGAGLRKLTQPAKNGHQTLYLRKTGAAALLALLGYVLIYGINLAILGGTLGFEHWDASVQSLYGYANCPLAISVWEAVGIVFTMKFLWMLACLAVCQFCCAVTGTAVYAVGGMALLCGIAAVFQLTPNLWLRNLSFSYLSQPQSLLQGAVYLNFFGTPVSRILAALIYLLLLTMALLFLECWIFCRTSSEGKAARKFELPSLGKRHTNLFLQEMEKGLFNQHGLIILLLFLCLQVWTYSDERMIYSTFEQYYRSYSEILQGEPATEKESYLSDEAQRYGDIHQEIQDFVKKHPDSSNALRQQYDALRGEDPFNQAKQQYEQLRPGQSYLYQTGYSRMFAPFEYSEDLVNYGKLFFVLVLLTAGMFAAEQESGMSLLQAASGKTGKICRYKALLCFFYAVSLTVIAFLPKYIAVFQVYGGFLPQAQANSISWLANLPDGMTVLSYIVLQFVFRTVVTAAAAAMVCLVSQKTGKTVLTMELCLPVLLLPVAVMLLL